MQKGIFLGMMLFSTAAALHGASQVTLRSVQGRANVDFVLPDGRLKNELGLTIGVLSAQLSTLYDFPLGEIAYHAGVEGDFSPWKTRLSFSDDVQFERLLQKRKFLGRFQGAALEGTRKISKVRTFTLRASTSANRLLELERAQGLEAERSRQNMFSVILQKHEEGENRSGDRRERRSAWRLDQAVRLFHGDFEYTNLLYESFFKEEASDRLRATMYFTAGSVLDEKVFPSFARFQRGGWDGFRGFQVQELEGKHVAFFRGEGFLRLWKTEKKIPGRVFFERLWLLNSADFGQLNDHRSDFTVIPRYRFSWTFGLQMDFSFRKRLPFALTFAYAKPIEHRDGVFYLRYQL